jgi:hypothetical protein
MDERLTIRRAAVVRVKTLAFGDPVTNVCAGEGNPMIHCYFVQLKGQFACCTDRKGHFWDIGIEVVYPGHLPKDERERLFSPVWESKFGKRAVSATREQEQT